MSSSPTTKNLPGHEYPRGDEDAIAASMANELKAQLDRLYGEQRMMRQIHPKMHGCVKAAFTVAPDLPDELKVGVFAEARTYHAWVRFSNANTVMQSDAKKDVRGVAIKLMGVAGEKILNDQHLQSTQDFLLMNTETFFSHNVEEFSGLLAAATAPSKLKLLTYILSNPFTHLPLIMRAKSANQFCAHTLGIPYYSTQPYQFGNPSTAVKYLLRPSENNELVIENTVDNDYLRFNMAQTLNSHAVEFDFCVQFQTDPDRMPIEDPTVKWASPFVKLATLHIPPQAFDSREQMLFGDSLSFNSWHSLPAHRPLGSFNRVRRRVYESLSKYRHDRNRETVFEPSDSPDFLQTGHVVRDASRDTPLPAKVKRATASVLVSVDPKTAYEFIASGEKLPSWLKKSGRISGAKSFSIIKGPYDHVGAMRKVDFNSGDSVIEELVRVDPWVGYRYRVTGFTNFFKHLTDAAFGEVWLDRVGDRTRITWVYAYTYKNFFAGLFIGLFNKIAFSKFMQQGLNRARVIMDEAD